MKVIWIYRVLADGQTHITTWRETHRHLKDEHEIHYIFPYAREARCFTDKAVLIRKLKWPGLAFVHYIVSAFFAFMRLDRKVQPDIVIFDQFSALFSLLYTFRRRRPGLILDLRQAKYSNESRWISGRVFRTYTRWILRFNRRYQDGITYISEGLRQQLLKDMAMPLHENYLIWPSGVDVNDFRPGTAEAPPADKKELQLFFHGSVTRDRGIAESISALALVSKKGLPMRFTVVGEGGFLPELKALARQLAVDHLVDFRHFVPFEQVPALIAEADVCMMPYPINDYWEGNVPIKILEYMAMEKVVLCTNLVAFRTITRGAACAHIIADNSPERIAAGLERLYLQRAELPQWGRTGREIVKTGYTWQAIATDIDAFLRRVVAARESLAPAQR